MSNRRVYDEFPFAVVDIEIEDHLSERKKSVQVGPKKFILSQLYKQYGLQIYNFEARPDDVYLLGYPRSGTTLHSEMVWLIGNDLNFEYASKYFIDYRFPHIDFSVMGTLGSIKNIVSSDRCKDVTDEMRDIVSKYEELTLEGLTRRNGKRFIKSHLPISLMPPHIFEVGAKVIYCARNPKDTLVSFYNAQFFFKLKNRGEYSFRQFFNDIKNDRVWWCPYFEHVKEAWAKRNEKNFLFLFYEDTIKDKKRTMTRVANFLDKNLSNDQLEVLDDHLSFEKFKNNETVNCGQLVKIGLVDNNKQFIRKGKSGGWRDYFVEDLGQEVDEWIKKNLAGTDLRFPGV